MNLEEQKKQFQQNWQQYHGVFGSQPWEADPDFLFFIDVPAERGVWQELEDIQGSLKSLADGSGVVFPKEFHITLALPGRQGVHFQGNDVKFMEKELESLLGVLEPFDIELGNLNCFGNVIFREVYDPSGQLYNLHREICKRIPFAQKPEFQMDHFIPHLSLLYADQVGTEILSHPQFSRTLSTSALSVKHVCLGKAKGSSDHYQREVVKMFDL